MEPRIKPQRILFVLHGSIGDVARALPLANLVRRGFPGATISWAAEPLAAPLVEHHPAIDEVILFDRARAWRSFVPFLSGVRSRRFDLVLDLQRHLKSGLVSYFSGARVRVGFHRRDAKEWNWLFNNRHIPSVGENGASKLSVYLKFAELLGIDPHPVEWRLKLTPGEERRVEDLLAFVPAAFAVFFVGSSWSSKQWFPRQTAESAAEIRRRYGLGIVLLGGKGDVDFGQEVERNGGVELANLIGRTNLREAVGVLARARIAIGPDTGLMHLAAAVETPVVSLWGATEPAWSGPHGNEHLVIRGRAHCSPCYLRRCPIGQVCMQSIRVSEVVARVGQALLDGEAADARLQ